MPPPGSLGSTRNIEWVRKWSEIAPAPSLTVYHTIRTSGVSAMRNATVTSVVNSRFTACRRPSTPKLASVCSATNSSSANTTKPALPANPVVAHSSSVSSTAATANPGSAYIGSVRPRSDGPEVGTSVRGSAETATSGPLPAAGDDQLGGEVDRQRDDEQAQPGGDQGVGADGAGLAVLQRDVHGERDTAGLGDVPADPVDGGQHDGDRERLAEGPAEAEDGGGHHAAAPERQDRGADHLPAGGAERQRSLHLVPRHLPEHLPGDRGDDRQDHDRQDDAGGEVGEVVRAVLQLVVEQRDPAEPLVQPE